MSPAVLARTSHASHPVLAPSASSGLEAALHWLAKEQSSDGSYGEGFPPYTAAAAYALWLNDTHSSKARSEEHTSELQSRGHLVCRLLLEKKKKNIHQA